MNSDPGAEPEPEPELELEPESEQGSEVQADGTAGCAA